jgi:cytochrome c biogenesis protein CcdA
MFSLLFALLAGTATIVAPCALPVLPILLGTSLGNESRWRPIAMALGFIATFAAVTLAFHFVTTLFGLGADQLRSIAIVVLSGFGILLVWPGLYERLQPYVAGATGHLRSGGNGSYRGVFGGFVLGTTLGLVWTPCAGPVLGSILTLLATQPNVTWAGILLVFYAIGASLPMIAIGYGGQFAIRRVRNIAPYTHRMQQVFGVLVVGFAAAMFFQYDTDITAWLSSFTGFGSIGL